MRWVATLPLLCRTTCDATKKSTLIRERVGTIRIMWSGDVPGGFTVFTGPHVEQE